MTYMFSTGSGYLNSPPRVMLIGNDNRPGSYPVDVHPQMAASNSDFASSKPFNDTIAIDTPIVYAQARVKFTGIPGSGESMTLLDAAGNSSTFTFRRSPASLVVGPGSYNVSLSGIVSTATPYDVDLTPGQIMVKRSAERLIEAINATTGSLIEASPTSNYGVVLLTQKIPGTAGNVSNSYTSEGEFEVENFTGGRDTTVRYPYGVPVGPGSFSSDSLISRVIKGARTGTLDVPASGKASLLDAPSNGHPWCDCTPFDETGATQAFGIATGGSRTYGVQTSLTDEFFTRGSTLGNLDEPLWVKDKIEIDLAPNISTTIQRNNTSDLDFPMCYYNFSQKKWERIGFGKRPSQTSDFINELENCYIGFSQGYANNLSLSSGNELRILDKDLSSKYSGDKYNFAETGWNSPIDTFGFPVHPKFHATSSQTLEVSSLIDRPFLVEKIVYEFSGSSTQGAALVPDGLFYEYASPGAAFFILNQRKANPDSGIDSSYTKWFVLRSGSNIYGLPYDGGSAGVDYIEGTLGTIIPQTRQLAPSGPNIYVDSTRDLVTFARVGGIWDAYKDDVVDRVEEGFPHPASFMDLAVNAPTAGSFNGRYTVCADVKAPSKNIGISAYRTYHGHKGGVAPSTFEIYLSKDSSTRNSLDLPTGRSNNTEFFGSKLAYSCLSVGSSPGAKSRVYASLNDAKPSPYLLLPGDKLVLGWQSSISYLYNANGPDFSIHPGAGKLTLYGSYLQDSKPIHNIYKSPLGSDALHEAIPAGPWVLDRFESEPQMMYSSSMREEHVTGTMLTKNADGSLSVTPVNDLSIGGVRAVSARVSDGTVRQRWSFFRNNRLFDEEEQYYDSMQLNPLEVLLNYNGSTSYPVSKASPAGTSEIFISIPDERLYFGGPPYTMPSSGSNRAFIGSFAYELPKYQNIDRVKKINSTVMTGRKYAAFNGSTGLFDLDTIIAGISYLSGDRPDSIGASKSMLQAPGGLLKGGTFTKLLYRHGPSKDYDTNPVKYNVGAWTSLFTPEFDQNDVNFHLSRQLGCFGDGYMKMLQYIDDGISVGPFTDPVILTGSIYRGTRYGLINPTPFYSNAVFNGTQYGQLRDMMEQRQYTRFSLTDNTLTDAAVSVQFINRSAAPGTLNITSGSATNSSNISKFATSEHPYDDGLVDTGQIWDRDSALPETLITL